MERRHLAEGTSVEIIVAGGQAGQHAPGYLFPWYGSGESGAAARGPVPVNPQT